MASLRRDSTGLELRRIAVIGAGPMGASLAAITSSRVPTVLVARDPARADRIRASGIELEGALSARGHPDVVTSIDALACVHPIDLVFIATKTTALREVCDSLRPRLGELPFLVSYQNGIEPGRTIIRMLGTPRVVRMVLRYGAVIDEPAGSGGPLRVHVGLHDPPHFVGGEGEAAAFARDLAPVIEGMGLPMEFTEDIEGEAWRKGIGNAAGNPVAALVQAPLGELLDSPARGLIERLLDEGISVARAAKIEIEPSFREAVLHTMAGGRSHLPSMAQDVLAGRPTEITQLNEQIALRGRELGIPTPTHDAVLDLVRVLDWRAARGVAQHRAAPAALGSGAVGARGSSGRPLVGPVPLLEELCRASAAVLGADLDGYRNHAQRVFHFARALGAEGPESEHKLAIACHFHDLGIWTDHTFDYLEPSVALAAAYLDEQGHSEWAAEISWMIREHHKVTSAGDTGSLVEIFRRADWIDVSLGVRRFGVPRAFVREVRRAFPNCGFHRRLVALTLGRLRSHPLSPLPMFRW